MAIDTLEELDWCLEQLENIETHSSVSDMAANKFKEMLNKELMDFSESSKSGNQIKDYITSTYYGKYRISLTPASGMFPKQMFSKKFNILSCR